MIRIESGCVDCGMHCRGRACRHYEETRVYCDKCDEGDEPIYEHNGQHLCIGCIEESLTRVGA